MTPRIVPTAVEPILERLPLAACVRVRAIGQTADAPPPTLERWLSAAWPIAVGSSTTNGSRSVLCLGPTEWVALSSVTGGDGPTVANDAGWIAVDQCDALVAYRIDAAYARTALPTVCALDFRAARWPAGACTRTRLAGIGAIVWHASAAHWVVLVAASHRSYLPSALASAAVGITTERRDGTVST